MQRAAASMVVVVVVVVLGLATPASPLVFVGRRSSVLGRLFAEPPRPPADGSTTAADRMNAQQRLLPPGSRWELPPPPAEDGWAYEGLEETTGWEQDDPATGPRGGVARLQRDQHQPRPSTTTSPPQGGKGLPPQPFHKKNKEKNNKNKKPRLQTVDFTALLLTCRELNATMVPSRLEGVRQPDAKHVILGLRTAVKHTAWLELCWDSQAARLTEARLPPATKENNKADKATTNAYSFAQTIKSLVQGHALKSVGLAEPFGRVVRLEFCERLSEPATWHLYVEVMSGRSNVVLVDARTQTIAACAYQVGASRTVRPLQTGGQYVLPPPKVAELPVLGSMDALGGGDLGVSSSLDAWRSFLLVVPDKPFAKALVDGFKGMSPALAEHMLTAAAGQCPSTAAPADLADTPLPEVTDEQWEFAYFAWRRWLDTLAGTHPARPRLDSATGAYKLVDFQGLGRDRSEAPEALEALDAPEKLEASDGSPPTTSVQQLLARYFSEEQRRSEYRDTRAKCTQRVETMLKRARKRTAEFQQQLEKADEAAVANWRGQGDLITAYAHSYQPGDRHVLCYDFDTGDKIKMPVPQGKTAAEEAARLYNKAAKLKRSVHAIGPLAEQAQQQLEYVQTIQASLELLPETSALASDLVALRDIREELGLDALGAVAQQQTNALLPRVFADIEAGADGKSSKDAGGKPGKKGKGKSKPAKAGKGKPGGAGAAGAKRKSLTAGLLVLALNNTVVGNDGGDATGAVDELRSARTVQLVVGRNSRQNDRVTFELAKKSDVWFHARGFAGAHCLIRLDPGEEAGEQQIQSAADVAAFLSKGRPEKRVPVSWTSPSQLRRPKNAPPGAVLIGGTETVVYGDPERGARLVDESRTDDNPSALWN